MKNLKSLEAVHTHTHTHGILLKKEEDNQNLGIVDKEQSIIIRAICCIIVILVHIPKEHGNPIQDIIGSFGYIAVTLFFMFSAYGLKYSVANKENYLHNFWKNRILVLLIPFWITKIINTFINPTDTILNNILNIIRVKNISFITILVCYYIIFWIIYKLVKKEKKADVILCIITLFYSILGVILNIGWPVEAMGFIYGILIYYLKLELIKINKLKYCLLTGVSSFILGILYLKYKHIYFLGTWVIRMLLGLNIIILLIIIFNKITIQSKILKYIGTISYEIYLLHGIVINLIDNIDIPSTLWIILCIMLTILISTILKFIDTRIIKFIKNEWRKNENSNDRT